MKGKSKTFSDKGNGKDKSKNKNSDCGKGKDRDDWSGSQPQVQFQCYCSHCSKWRHKRADCRTRLAQQKNGAVTDVQETDVNVAPCDALERRVVNSAGLLTDEIWLQAFGADSDDVTITKLIDPGPAQCLGDAPRRTRDEPSLQSLAPLLRSRAVTDMDDGQSEHMSRRPRT